MLKNGGKIKELSREYLILSFFMLIRHVRSHYVVDAGVKIQLREFFDSFYSRWRATTLEDREMARFVENRQQSPTDLRERDLVLRELLFRFLQKKSFNLIAKDTKRAFDEADRIAIYRTAKGICSICIGEGKSESEATVPWNEYEADHVLPHTHGGKTDLINAQLLCRPHNRSKGARIA